MGEEVQESTFDVAAAVAAFVNNDAVTSLELPRSLSKDQRKQAKTLADQHKGLKCESFGFGGDRQLHLFKQAGQLGTVAEDREPWSPVRVKNTFIDDFVDKDAEGSAEHLHFRSLPNRFGSNRLWDEQIQEELQPAVKPPQQLPPPQQPPPPAAISEGSTGSAEARSESGSSSLRGAPELPELPEGYKFTVRDTFIHIEAEREHLAERVTQSMPDGVFQRHLQAEMLERAAQQQQPPAAPLSPPPTAPPPATPTSPPPSAAPPSPPPAAAPAGVPAGTFATGTEVTIEGLLKLPAFNGRAGTIDSFDAAQGRYNVLLDAPAAAGGSRWAKVKGENLRLRLPPPPHHSPMLAANPPVLSVDTFYYAPPSQDIPATPQWEGAVR